MRSVWRRKRTIGNDCCQVLTLSRSGSTRTNLSLDDKIRLQIGEKHAGLEIGFLGVHKEREDSRVPPPPISR